MARKRKIAIHFYIYKTTNLINGKIYVGQRGCETVPEKDVDYIGSGVVFGNAIKKYGRENFQKEIVEKCIEPKLNEKEVYWIAYYKSKNPSIGYNLTDGGDATRGFRFADDSKQKMSKAKKGKVSTFKGKRHTEDSKIKLSESKKGKPSKNKGRKMGDLFCEIMRRKKLKYRYIILTPLNEVIETNNLRQFSDKNDLTARAIDDSLRGYNNNGDRVLNHKGYVLLVKKKIGETVSQDEIQLAINKYNSLDKTKKKVPIEAIRRGAAKRVGIKLSEDVIEKFRKVKIKYNYKIKTPSGETVNINNVKQFSRERGLDNGNLMYTLRGYNSQGKTLSQHKGYKVISKEKIENS